MMAMRVWFLVLFLFTFPLFLVGVWANWLWNATTAGWWFGDKYYGEGIERVVGKRESSR